MTSTPAGTVDPSNEAASRAWDGTDGDYWVEHEAVFDESLRHYRQPFLEAAAIERSDRVLDVGCGNGQTTLDAARLASSGSVLGVDLSSRMLEQADRRAAEAGIANVAFLQADAQVHPFVADSFDVAISRTGAMFFGDPVAAFANIGRALRLGGRLTLLVWQALDRNHWVRDFNTALAAGRELPPPAADAPGPFSLADTERSRSILEESGFTDIAVEGVEGPMWFGVSAEQAFRFVRGQGFTQFLLRDLDEVARAGALADLRASIDAHHTDDGVLYPSATWIITARRR